MNRIIAIMTIAVLTACTSTAVSTTMPVSPAMAIPSPTTLPSPQVVWPKPEAQIRMGDIVTIQWETLPNRSGHTDIALYESEGKLPAGTLESDGFKEYFAAGVRYRDGSYKWEVGIMPEGSSDGTLRWKIRVIPPGKYFLELKPDYPDFRERLWEPVKIPIEIVP